MLYLFSNTQHALVLFLNEDATVTAIVLIRRLKEQEHLQHERSCIQGVTNNTKLLCCIYTLDYNYLPMFYFIYIFFIYDWNCTVLVNNKTFRRFSIWKTHVIISVDIWICILVCSYGPAVVPKPYTCDELILVVSI